MWGKRRKRRAQLPRQLALGLLEDAMAWAEQQQGEQQQGKAEPEPVRYPGAVTAAPPKDPSLRTADVPVDNSAEPAAAGDAAPLQQELPAKRKTDRTRHGPFG